MSTSSALARLSVAIVAIAALTVSLLTPTEAALAEPTPVADVPFVVPAPPVAPAPVMPESTIPEGTFSASDGIVLEEQESGPKNGPYEPIDVSDVDFDDLEIVEQTEFSNVYAVDDGLKVAELSPIPLNSEVGGEWGVASEQHGCSS